MDERRRKIQRNIYIVFGVSALLLIGMVAAWFLLLVRPQNDEIAKVRGNYEARAKVAETLGAELVHKAKAAEQKQYLDGQLAFLQTRYRSLYFDKIEGDGPLADVNRDRTWRRWMNEYYSEFGVEARQELIAAANETGVIIKTSIKVDAPPKVPEEVAPPASGFLKPTGASGGALGVSITGTFPDILRFLNRINLSPILMSVGNIKLDGYSPTINASFTITPYLLSRGTEITTSVAQPAGDAPAGGAPGAGAPGGALPGPGGGVPGAGGPGAAAPGGAPPAGAPAKP